MSPLTSQSRFTDVLVNQGGALQKGSLLSELVESGPSLIVSAYAHCTLALTLLFYP